jgi:hypothetical protein
MRKRNKIILGLCIGFVAASGLYLGLSALRDTASFETKMVCSLPCTENEKIGVRYMTCADLTGDGRKEILVNCDVYSYEEQMIDGTLNTTMKYKEAQMVIFSSNATGDFHKSWEYSSGLTIQTAATGDFDSDCRPDIVVGGVEVEDVDAFPPVGTSRVEVLFQGGDGAFHNVFSSDVPEFFGPGSIMTGDFDGDGRIDFIISGLALESESPYHAYLFHNGGEGSFTASPIALKEGIIVEDMWKTDIDNDESLDLVIQATELSSGTHSLILLSNDGRGEFASRELDVPVDSMIIGDFTGDGYPSIIYTKSDQSGDKVYFLRNDKGEFTEPSSIDVLSGKIIVGMISADFNNDNTPDVLFFEHHPEFREDLERFEIDLNGHLLLIEETADGGMSFTRARTHEFLEGKGISLGHAAVAADINDDGWLDLILVSGEGEIYAALNQQT